jgi:hypothetical protein
MNRLKKEMKKLLNAGFCLRPEKLYDVGRAMAALNRKLPQQGLINFGIQLNAEHWIEQELNAKRAVLLRDGKALIF